MINRNETSFVKEILQDIYMQTSKHPCGFQKHPVTHGLGLKGSVYRYISIYTKLFVYILKIIIDHRILEIQGRHSEKANPGKCTVCLDSFLGC